MNFPNFSVTDTDSIWSRYCELQWFHKKLGMWLDISKMHINPSDLKSLESKFPQVYASMTLLENGAISNIDENRQVGHYWLRTPSIAPETHIKLKIEHETSKIIEFSNQILTGTIKSSSDHQFTDVLWIGIGGSGLGPSLIVNALGESKTKLKFHFIDNVDPEGISNKLSNLSDKLSSTLFVVVSKSGGTPEPNIAMNITRKYVEDKKSSWEPNAVAITMSGSKLDNLAIEQNWLERFDLPDWVGGRTSITSSVGLLPAALMNVDIIDFLSGASIMDEATRSPDLRDNPAALLASSWYVAGQGKGKKDMVVLPYKDRLELFSKYLQQLVMESLGKKIDKEGNNVNQGIAVYGNKGSTDQHAYVQQLRDGIDNFFVNFIEILDDYGNSDNLKNLSSGDHLSGFLNGTKQALLEGGRESLTITLEKLNASSLGSLIALYERAVGFYAEMININAYDQPGVEAGKAAASKILEVQSRVENLLSDNKARTLDEIADQISFNEYDQLFSILRHLVYSREDFKFKGDFTNPTQLIFLRNN